MSDHLRELYQEVILDHSRNPKHFGTLAHATHEAKGDNPTCGDRISVQLEIDDGKIQDIAFTGEGCAIAKASGSLMAEAVQGKTVEEVKKLWTDLQLFLEPTPHNSPTDTDTTAHLGKLAALGGVREFPSRIKCATLSWHALEHALNDKI